MQVVESSELDALAKKRHNATRVARLERTAYRADSELVQQCLDGDQAAWKELVSRYARLVYSIPRRYGLAATDADDVFQNVFTIVFRRLGTLRNETRLTAWLITVTHRETMRLGKVLPRSDELDESAPDDDAPPLDQVQAWERQHLVHLALDQLGPPCRELVTALFLDSETPNYEKIAARLGLAVGGIGPTRARCFRKLEAILIALGFDAGS
ncbi:MAG: sigma-70 family RNA polymerase sigma factor [Chloroflexi bacterium]|nr:sigma-70 family RNA polymerase sigma factor [Chloroflexota bacterium]